MKPPLTYYGGKQKLISTLLPLFPKHNLYCEPFFGGGALFFAKEPSPIEVINDVNSDLINFYKVAKKSFKELSGEIALTLNSRDSHQSAKIILNYPKLFTDVKRAWAIWSIANQSYASKLDGPWNYDKSTNTTSKRLHNKRIAFTKEYAKRLEQTQIECSDALYVIQSRDTNESFFFCDPPYFNSHCGHYKGYTKEDFIKLLDSLKSIKGKFLLTAYPSDILKKYVKKNKWQTKKITTALSLAANPDVKKKTKTEWIVTNYPIS